MTELEKANKRIKELEAQNEELEEAFWRNNWKLYDLNYFRVGIIGKQHKFIKEQQKQIDYLTKSEQELTRANAACSAIIRNLMKSIKELDEEFKKIYETHNVRP